MGELLIVLADEDLIATSMQHQMPHSSRAATFCAHVLASKDCPTDAAAASWSCRRRHTSGKAAMVARNSFAYFIDLRSVGREAARQSAATCLRSLSCTPQQSVWNAQHELCMQMVQMP